MKNQSLILSKQPNIPLKTKNIPFEKITFSLVQNKYSSLNKTNKKVGIVITTYGNNGIFVLQALKSFRLFIENNIYVVLFINEISDINIEEANKYTDSIVIINDQTKNKGLTGTWNQGIDLCFKENCETIILSNDDIFVTPDINHVIEEANKCEKSHLNYYGPLTNNPGHCSPCQYSLGPKNENSKVLYQNKKIYNLNGFFMVIPKHVLIANKFNDNLYFDEKYPFGGNENEWFRRLYSIGGKPILVPRSFVYHYKFGKWRELDGYTKINKKPTNICLYTCVTGNYDSKLYIDTSKFNNVDILYFTDNIKLIPELVKNNFKPMLVFDDNITDNKLLARYIKTNIEVIPKIYDTIIWYDGSVIPDISIMKYIPMNDYELVCWKHPDINKKTTHDELENVTNYGLITEDMKNYCLSLYKQYPEWKDDLHLTETNILIRKRTQNIENFCKEWCNHILKCPRDQVTFDFLRWKYKINTLQLDCCSGPSKHVFECNCLKPGIKYVHCNMSNRFEVKK